MCKIDTIIQQYCPDGLGYVPLCSIGTIKRGNGLQKKDFVKSGVGCIHYGQIYTKFKTVVYKPLTYVSEELASHLLHVEKGDLVIACTSENVEDVCKAVAWMGEETIVTGGHSCVLHHNQNPKYVAYFFQTEYFQQQKKKYAYGTKVIDIKPDNLGKILIPIPPIPVQEEIVRVLDTFTELQAELQAELQKREQQYDYYQDLLLNKSQFSHLISIGDICDIKKGNTPIQKAREGDYPLVVTTMERRSSDTYQFNANAVCIPLISSRGHGVASLNHVYYQEGKFALGNILCAVIPHDEKVLKAKFLYYYLEYAKDYTLVPLMKGGANVSMHCSDIEKVKIPIPSIQEQERIISILDKFDTLTNDLTTGLPAEIEKRKQQYEFYRDKLLTFK